MRQATYVFILAFLAFALPAPEAMAAKTDTSAATAPAQNGTRGQEQGLGQGQEQGQRQYKQGKEVPGNRAGKQGGYGKRSGPRDDSGPGNGPKDGTGPYHDAENPRWKQ